MTNYSFQKSETTIRIFNRSDFYTIHGADALFVAKEFFGSMNNIKKFRSGKKHVTLIIYKTIIIKRFGTSKLCFYFR